MMKYYKTRIRAKGQVTVPENVRDFLGIKEGDDLAFYITDEGKVMIQPLQTIDPDQAWFWTERWQQMEREAQADIDAGREKTFDNIEDALKYLEGDENAGN